MRSILLLSALLFFLYVSRTFGEDAKKGAIVRARLEVKAFIREQLPHYHHVNIMYIPGKDPAMVFLDADNKVVLEEDVSEKSLEEIGQFLEKHGMVKSREARSEVPEDPWEGESEELDESWEEEEDGDEGDEPWDEEGTEGPETEEYEEDEGNDATEHTEL